MILPGSSSAGATRSASPASMALRGMLSNLAEAGSCTNATPRLFLDGPQAQRAVGAHAGEDDADAPLLPVVGQGAEEEIDREAQAAGRRRLEQVQHAVQDGHVLVGRDHVDAVRLDPHAGPRPGRPPWRWRAGAVRA